MTQSIGTGRKQQRGVMLLEALIAILIFSMGILAMVGMQATTISTVSDAKYRADAAFLANQVIGQMWVDQANLASYAYTTGTPPAVLANWVAQVQSGLPGVTNTLNPPQIVIGAGNQITVRVFWQPPQAATPHSHMAIATINP